MKRNRPLTTRLTSVILLAVAALGSTAFALFTRTLG
jgi:hypothetical protein